MQTEHPFVLPKGYDAPSGETFREGTMRLARADDEIAVLGDARVQANKSYAVILLLSRVIEKIGALEGDAIDTTVIENLFTADLAYLQDRYRELNEVGAERRTCPHCGEEI